ncbi:MAG TPA: hypothetical protein PK080_00080 [Hyphomonadaceae bacterium]|nr:hypothetical protein [Hyphomonadaceae bacterium]
MFKLSLASRVLDALGRLFIFSPSDHGMPPDFFHVPGDRYLPSSDELSKPSTKPSRIATDAFRRRVLTATAWASSGYATVLCIALYTIAHLLGFTRH